MRHLSNAFVAISVVALAALVGCASNKAETKTVSPAAMKSGPSVNAKCCCGKPLDGKSYVMYNGQKVGFCGPECVNEFNAMTDAQKQAQVAKATAAKPDHPSDHPK
jgi:hypothetical protein